MRSESRTRIPRRWSVTMILSPMRAATLPSSTSTRSVTEALPICASARASRCMRTAMVGTSSPAILALGWISCVYQQFWRLLGIDQFQINGIGAKYWEPDDSFVRSFEAIKTPLFSPDDCPLPVVGSGQWGGQAPETFRRTGRTQDLLYLCGGGIVSHPGGPAAGVRAVRQAWEAAVADIPLDDYARRHQELAQSIAKFGQGGGDA